MPDQHGYPTVAELDRIRHWPDTDWHALMDFVRSIWWAADWGWIQEGDEYHLSTGGWSGNEEIIRALKEDQSSFFWSFCWESSRQGGHYVFKVRWWSP